MNEVRVIIAKAISDGDYDGLFNDNCSCNKDDLWPCGQIHQDCKLGVYRDCSELGHEPSKYDFCIGDKPEKFYKKIN